MKLIFMVEEQSMKEVLNIILPKILPPDTEFRIIPHNGKSDLAASIPKKLQAWQNPDDRFVIVHDQDSNDCVSLKNELLKLCANSRNTCLVRIVCKELEAWYFGDLNAVSRAYGKNLKNLSNKRKYRTPDTIANAKEEICKLISSHQQISGAQKIAPYMDIDKNTSHCFNVFVDGVRRIV